MDAKWDEIEEFIIESTEELREEISSYEEELDEMGWNIKILMATEWQGDIMDDLVEYDTSFAVFSVLFVFIYMIIHLRSLFLAIVGMMLILLSFPLTVIITEGLLRSTYFS